MSEGQLAGPRVLVIEDDPAQAAGVEELLKGSGFVIAGRCVTLAGALDQVRAHDPALAVVDVNLDGRSAAPLVLELEAVGVPCVVTTDRGTRGIERFCDLPVLTKPLVREDLISAMQRLLWRDRAQAGSPRRPRPPSRALLPAGLA